MIDYLENHLLPCPFKTLTGCDCPGCGMQRAIIHALRGDVVQSLTTHPAAIPSLLLFTFILFNLYKKWSFGHLIIRWGLIFIALISILQWLIKFAL